EQPNSNVLAPSLAVAPHGDAFLAVRLGMGPTEVLGFAWDNANQSWSEPIPLAPPGEPGVLGTILVAIKPTSGDVFVAWDQDGAAHVAHLDADTQIWDEQVFEPVVEQKFSTHLRVLSGGEVMLILWDRTSDPVGTISSVVHDGSAWEPEQILTDITPIKGLGLF